MIKPEFRRQDRELMIQKSVRIRQRLFKKKEFTTTSSYKISVKQGE
jgi:hypothetical protein